MTNLHNNAEPSFDGYSEYGTEKLREEGYRITPQRRAILELFERKDEHLTAQSVFDSLQKEVGSLSLATVYNTLELFEDTGLLQRITARDGQTFYDPNLDPHHHAVCNDCGEIFDLEIAAEPLESLAESSNSMIQGEAFEVQEVAVWFRGTCAMCRSSEN